MDGQASCHCCYGLVFFAGVMKYPQKCSISIVIHSDPDPGRFNEIGPQLRSAGFSDRARAKGLARLDNSGRKADVLCHFGFVVESCRREYFSGVLSGDDIADAWVCFEQLDFLCVFFFAESLSELMCDGLELFLQKL